MTVNFGMMNPYMTSVDVDAMMNAPLMSMNSGINTSPYMTGMAGVPGFAGAYAGLGNFGMVGGFNQQQYMNNIQQWDNFGVNRQVTSYNNQNNARFEMQSKNGSIEYQVKILAQEIKANNQDNVKAAYQNLLNAIKTAYGSQLQGSEEEKMATLRQYADSVYTQMTGSYMTEDLKENGRSAFGDGFMKIFSFGMGNKRSVAENLEMITGQEQTAGSKASNKFGKILGTICTLGLGLLGQ